MTSCEYFSISAWALISSSSVVHPDRLTYEPTNGTAAGQLMPPSKASIAPVIIRASFEAR